MRAALSLVLLGLTMPVCAEELTIATFNTEFLTRPKVHVKFDYPFDLRAEEDIALWTDEYRDAKFAEAASDVAIVVASLDADIVVLTEIGDAADVDELNAAVAGFGVAYPYTFVCQCTDYSTQQRVAVLSSIPLDRMQPSIAGVEGYFEEADDDDSQNETGISKGMSVQFQFAGRTVTLYGVHLISEGNGAEADEQRVAQASILRRHALEQMEKGELFIIAGDLNDGRGQPAVRRVQGYDDIWPDLIQTGDTAFFDPADWNTRWTYEYEGTPNQIDHILLSPAFLSLLRKSDIHTTIPEQTTASASDHRPIIVRLQID